MKRYYFVCASAIFIVFLFGFMFYRQYDKKIFFGNLLYEEIDSRLGVNKKTSTHVIFNSIKEFTRKGYTENDAIVFLTFLLLMNSEVGIADIALLTSLDESFPVSIKKKLQYRWNIAIINSLQNRAINRHIIRRFLEGNALIIAKSNEQYHDWLSRIHEIFLLQNDKSFYKEITALQKELDYIRKNTE